MNSIDNSDYTRRNSSNQQSQPLSMQSTSSQQQQQQQQQQQRLGTVPILNNFPVTNVPNPPSLLMTGASSSSAPSSSATLIPNASSQPLSVNTTLIGAATAIPSNINLHNQYQQQQQQQQQQSLQTLANTALLSPMSASSIAPSLPPSASAQTTIPSMTLPTPSSAVAMHAHSPQGSTTTIVNSTISTTATTAATAAATANTVNGTSNGTSGSANNNTYSTIGPIYLIFKACPLCGEHDRQMFSCEYCGVNLCVSCCESPTAHLLKVHRAEMQALVSQMDKMIEQHRNTIAVGSDINANRSVNATQITAAASSK